MSKKRNEPLTLTPFEERLMSDLNELKASWEPLLKIWRRHEYLSHVHVQWRFLRMIEHDLSIGKPKHVIMMIVPDGMTAREVREVVAREAERKRKEAE